MANDDSLGCCVIFIDDDNAKLVKTFSKGSRMKGILEKIPMKNDVSAQLAMSSFMFYYRDHEGEFVNAESPEPVAMYNFSSPWLTLLKGQDRHDCNANFKILHDSWSNTLSEMFDDQETYSTEVENILHYEQLFDEHVPDFTYIAWVDCKNQLIHVLQTRENDLSENIIIQNSLDDFIVKRKNFVRDSAIVDWKLSNLRNQKQHEEDILQLNKIRNMFKSKGKEIPEKLKNDPEFVPLPQPTDEEIFSGLTFDDGD